MRDTLPPKNQQSAWHGLFAPFSDAAEYMIDATQRGILFCDVIRQRSEQYHEHMASTAPNVLDYAAKLIIDGRGLDRPVNYLLVQIVPPAGVEVDPKRRPFVVVDPRAGHGPGIGGFKADSEIGVALKAGHPCYFIGFLPKPMPGQTIEDVARAEAVFLEKVIALHPQAEGKPCVIGNCQAGWAVMMLAAVRPELFGPIIVAGSPLSYWAGVHGKNPMRYSGGLLGGSWLTALTSDLGRGTFDGVWLVQNFESLNPSNTMWSKPYNLYSKIDSEASRYLGFERWWGGHVDMNAEEIQFIVDNLFVGNNLAAGRVQASDGTAIDLRNIRSPIVVFCSKGDNITPPQQALGWILDLYDSVDEIRSYGQTIVYTIHETVGHLGIFVSTGVARKEHDEFSGNIDMIEVLPPGLYEATFKAKTADTPHTDLLHGDWIMRCEQRTLDDIRALGCNDASDERRFETAARLSEVNLALYRTFMQPMVRAMVPEPVAEGMRKMHPLRLKYEIFTKTNPATAPLARLAERVREARKPVARDNVFLAMEHAMSDRIVAALDAWRDLNNSMSEWMFMSFYGSQMLQAIVGIDPASTGSTRRAAKSPLHRRLIDAKIAELKSRIAIGGLRECVLRGMLYVGLARGAADERGAEYIWRMRATHAEGELLTLAQFKTVLREQYFMLLIDEEATLTAIPAMLPTDQNLRRMAFATLREMLSVGGEPQGEAAVRLERIAGLFGVEMAAQPAQPGQTAEAAQAAHLAQTAYAAHIAQAARAAHGPQGAHATQAAQAAQAAHAAKAAQASYAAHTKTPLPNVKQGHRIKAS